MSFPDYNEYKQCEVGWLDRIPSSWGTAPLLAIARECDEPNNGMIEDNLLSLSYGEIVRKDIAANDGLLPESFETYQVVKEGDVVLRLTDLQNDKKSLRTGLVRERGIITSAYTAIRPDQIVPAYLAYLLRAYDLSKVFYSMGGGLRQSMKFSDLKRMPILLPSVTEQLAITKFLDCETKKIDALVTEQEKLIALLKEKRQATISRAVTKGPDPSVPMKHSGIEWFDEIPAHWDRLQLGRLCNQVSDGPHFSPKYVDEGVMFLSARNIKVDGWSLGDAKYISEEDYKDFSKRIVPEKGDVLYTKGGTTGVARVVDLNDRFQIWVHVAVLKIDKNTALPHYVAYALNSAGCYEQSQLFTRGATNQDLGLTRMVKIWLAVPPTLDEQEEIVRYLDEKTSRIDLLITQAKSAIELLKERRSALISAAVTGKIDVRKLVNAQMTGEEAGEAA